MTETIFRNLISNALKFTEPGGRILLSASIKHGKVTIPVNDTGIGIEPVNMVKLFKIDAKFQQKGTAGEKGTGLGLILCKEFVERHGGHIWCEAFKGQGSTCSFTLPGVSQGVSGAQDRL